MKLSRFASAFYGVVALLTLFFVCDVNAAPKNASNVTPKTQEQRLSYTIGVDLGKNFKRQSIDVNFDSFMQGLKDGSSGATPKLTDDQMKQTMQAFQKQLLAKRMKVFSERAMKNKKTGEEFLAKNKKKQGVVTLPSGLQYKVLTKGNGIKPKGADTVKVEYTGRLINGKVFDSSKKIGRPASFRVDRVIKGWAQAIQLMRVGATWEIYVPSSLAYGSRGVAGPIGPNETLIFKIHLVSIDKANDKTAAKKKSS